MRRAEDGQPLAFAAVDQLTGDEEGLHRLSDPDVVGDEEAHRVQLEPHEQGNELIRPGIYRDAAEGAERAGAGTETEPQRVAEQAAGAVVADLSGIG